MTHYSRTTLRELKKRYLNVLGKCLLANMGMLLISSFAIAGTATDASSLMAELEKNERTVVESGTHVLTYDETCTLYDEEMNSIIFPSVDISQSELLAGGRLYNKGEIIFNSDLKLVFTENKTESTSKEVNGGVIHNLGTMTFNSKADFFDNKSDSKGSNGGAVIYNKGTMDFKEHVNFQNNTATSLAGAADGVSIHNLGGVINFTSVDFINNQSGSEEIPKGRPSAIYNNNGGKITFTGVVNFKDNQANGSGGLEAGVIWNRGAGSTITFLDKTTFENNKAEIITNNAQAYGGAIENGRITTNIEESVMEFADVDFIRNKAIGTLDGIGGSIHNRGTMIFNGEALFQGNIAQGKTGYAYGGAIFNYLTGKITFKKRATFIDNITEGVTNATAALDNRGVTTFENGFYFEGNKTVLNQTLDDGTTLRIEKNQDIYMRADGVINIEGSDANATEYLGGGIGGINGMGTINKSSVATLVFGEESDSSGYTGIFNQTAGKTVAKSETFLGGTNNILGGELETYGSEILYTAIVGQNKDETTGEVLSSGTLTHLALGSAPVEIKGLSFEEEGANLSMTFKSGTTERGKYQINEDMLNAKGNKLAFENVDVYVDGNKTFGTVEVKNSDIDIGTNAVTVDEIVLKEDATLKMRVSSLSEYGQVNGIIMGTDISKIALQLGVDVEKGNYQLFDRETDVAIESNSLFNIKDLENGSFEIGKKTAEELSASLSVGKNEAKVLSAMMTRSTTNPVFKAVQTEVLEALQSENAATFARAKKALNAVGAGNTSIYQAQTTAHFTQMHAVISQMLMNTSTGVFGHNGGEEPARATVYMKGLYDRVNSLTGSGFRMRPKGVVLGVQSHITEDLTVGVGYAATNTIAKEELRRTEVDTNTGFISAQYQPNDWWMSGVLTYSRSQYEEAKEVMSNKGKSSYNVDSLGVQVNTGYNVQIGDWIITPEVGVRYINARQEAYEDSFGTKVDGTNSDYLTAMAGFKVGVDLKWIRPLAGVMVGYDIISDDITSVNTLANGATYRVEGKALDRLSTTVVAGFAADLGDNASLKLEYLGNYRKEYLDHSGMIRLEHKF